MEILGGLGANMLPYQSKSKSKHQRRSSSLGRRFSTVCRSQSVRSKMGNSLVGSGWVKSLLHDTFCAV